MTVAIAGYAAAVLIPVRLIRFRNAVDLHRRIGLARQQIVDIEAETGVQIAPSLAPVPLHPRSTLHTQHRCGEGLEKFRIQSPFLGQPVAALKPAPDSVEDHQELELFRIPGVVRPILRHLRIPEYPPPISPARGPPQTALLAVDPPSPRDQGSQGNQPTPERDPFDQSLPGDDGTWSA